MALALAGGKLPLFKRQTAAHFTQGVGFQQSGRTALEARQKGLQTGFEEESPSEAPA